MPSRGTVSVVNGFSLGLIVGIVIGLSFGLVLKARSGGAGGRLRFTRSTALPTITMRSDGTAEEMVHEIEDEILESGGVVDPEAEEERFESKVGGRKHARAGDDHRDPEGRALGAPLAVSVWLRLRFDDGRRT